MLDDLKYIHEKDVQDALGIAAKQPQQLTHSFKFDFTPKVKYDNIVYAGMGGSALAAQLCTSIPGTNVPFEICRQYNIPSYTDKKTLFIACSYSGNTEETISALTQAEKTGATIIVIAGGGKLQEMAEASGHTFILLPKASQPRYAVFYNLKAVWQILEKADLLNGKIGNLKPVASYLEKHIASLLPTVPAKKNPAKRLAQDLMGKSVVVYSGPFLSPAAYKWKISFNENAKNVAWQGILPEFSHNEFIGWSSHPVHKPYAVIDLRSSFDHPQIKKRFEISAKLLSGKRPHPTDVEAQGETEIEQMLWTVIMGDFTSIYLGLLNGVNPTPVELVEKLKQELA